MVDWMRRFALVVLLGACGAMGPPEDGMDAGRDGGPPLTCDELAALPANTPCDQPLSCVSCAGPRACGYDCYLGRVTLVCLTCDAGGPDAGVPDAPAPLTCADLASLPDGAPCDLPDFACLSCSSPCGATCYEGARTRACVDCDAGA
jgi:hypothetical protein